MDDNDHQSLSPLYGYYPKFVPFVPGILLMWSTDLNGTEFDGPHAAFLELRTRAQRAILDGDNRGLDVREWTVRLRDDAGTVLFEGTLADAARLEIDGRVYLPHQSP